MIEGRKTRVELCPGCRRGGPCDLAGTRFQCKAAADAGPAVFHETRPLSSHRQRLADEGHCVADGDGDCWWEGCPQARDGEPQKSGRHCPRDRQEDDR